MITVYPTGTTIYDPDSCYNGYTIFSYEIGAPVAKIINMNGNTVNEISLGRTTHRAKLLKKPMMDSYQKSF